VQFRRRLRDDLQTQVSYTYGHSTDSASSDFSPGGGFASLLGASETGPSDYDIRHNLSFSGAYRLLSPRDGFLGSLLGEWYADWVTTARTGLPFDVQGISEDTSNDDDRIINIRGGLFALVRADLIEDEAIWLDDPSAPGGRRLNRDAFEVPSGFQQGSLGRNALRGFGSFQVDLSLRRQLTISERWRLNLAVRGFNVLNHPNFANPSPLEGANLSSPNFGVATRMLNHSFGAGDSLFRSGGPRTVEFSLRLQF
jgi:hypothetical protein